MTFSAADYQVADNLGHQLAGYWSTSLRAVSTARLAIIIAIRTSDVVACNRVVESSPYQTLQFLSH